MSQTEPSSGKRMRAWWLAQPMRDPRPHADGCSISHLRPPFSSEARWQTAFSLIFARIFVTSASILASKTSSGTGLWLLGVSQVESMCMEYTVSSHV